MSLGLEDRPREKMPVSSKQNSVEDKVFFSEKVLKYSSMALIVLAMRVAGATLPLVQMAKSKWSLLTSIPTKTWYFDINYCMFMVKKNIFITFSISLNL
ncbi:MAG: hypothetical protein SFU27_14485 [Thermonemataceae bacterium]|nr:hypothetical protein [Thermonemataceae bacterium]